MCSQRRANQGGTATIGWVNSMLDKLALINGQEALERWLLEIFSVSDSWPYKQLYQPIHESVRWRFGSVCDSTDAMCTQQCSANEQKWIVRIVLKDMKVIACSLQQSRRCQQ